jgi:hypothetical protein
MRATVVRQLLARTKSYRKRGIGSVQDVLAFLSVIIVAVACTGAVIYTGGAASPQTVTETLQPGVNPFLAAQGPANASAVTTVTVTSTLTSSGGSRDAGASTSYLTSTVTTTSTRTVTRTVTRSVTSSSSSTSSSSNSSSTQILIGNCPSGLYSGYYTNSTTLAQVTFTSVPYQTALNLITQNPPGSMNCAS